MSKIRSTRTSNQRLSFPSGAAIETFSDLLADAPNLESVCLSAMQFAEETIGASPGVLIVQTNREARPLTIVCYGLDDQKMTQLNDFRVQSSEFRV